MTKFKPILFSTPMVEALLEGRKTMTRRIIDPQPKVGYTPKILCDHFGKKFLEVRKSDVELHTNPAKLKYQVGDILWVRETFYEPIFERLNGKYYYKADLEKQGWNFKWKPSIFMPKEACRLFLKVKAIRVERLQDISEDNAIAEGIEILGYNEGTVYRDYLRDHSETNNSIVSFSTLWESINGLHSWSSNPFVWVIEFEPIEKPKDFIV